ncbi:hypothetical protein [Neorhizobium sp. S3-V5DH]|nr:hypothetical protein [Neorhizobium sp. S3-V5DH]TCV62320.1 hypothetical protein EDE09_12485 [Neorhizobium sp. S3-V5DH]
MSLHRWEVVESPGYGAATYRMKVPGGWLYRYGNERDSSLVFVPEAAE